MRPGASSPAIARTKGANAAGRRIKVRTASRPRGYIFLIALARSGRHQRLAPADHITLLKSFCFAAGLLLIHINTVRQSCG